MNIRSPGGREFDGTQLEPLTAFALVVQSPKSRGGGKQERTASQGGGRGSVYYIIYIM